MQLIPWRRKVYLTVWLLSKSSGECNKFTHATLTFEFEIPEIYIAFQISHVHSLLTFFGARRQCIREHFNRSYGKEVWQFEEFFSTILSRFPKLR